MNLRDKDRKHPLPTLHDKPDTVNRAEVVHQAIAALAMGVNSSYRDIADKAWEMFRWKLSHKDIENVKRVLRKKGTPVSANNGPTQTIEPKKETSVPSVSLLPRTDPKTEEKKSRAEPSRLTQPQFFKLCVQLQKNEGEFSSVGFTQQQAAERLTRELGFEINAAQVRNAQEATGVKWTYKGSGGGSITGGGKQIQRALILAKRIVELYEQLNLPRPDDVHQMIEEMSLFGQNAKK